MAGPFLLSKRIRVCYNKLSKAKGGDFVHIILCLDDHNGMLFHHRRQSRDRVVIQEILESWKGKRIWISPFSFALFQGNEENVLVDESFLEKAKEGDGCFVEDKSLNPYKDAIESFTVYRWNRHYPADLVLDVDLNSEWHLVSQKDFPGYSHATITKEVYKR